MRRLLLLALALLPATAACQAALPCDGCEAIHERPAASLTATAVLAPPSEPGERLVVTGRVVHRDGHTPAPGIILYAWQTNAQGVYAADPGATGLAKEHGRLRGWVRTDAEGRYRLETIRPDPYPKRDLAAHIHVVVKQPDHPEYWIDDVVFTDDPLVTADYRARATDRGGSGIVAPVRDAAGIWQVRRDIRLEH
jgi:protocatechuate 3,4-dioxygenase, beta subunit